jgi:pimeloyl-ACP methyl ester carboxylesterase
MKFNRNKTFLPSIAALALLFSAGCTLIWDTTSDLYTDYVGSRSWVRGANLGDGRVVDVIDRTFKDGTLRGRFEGVGACTQVNYRMPASHDYVTVMCEAVLPQKWNGRVLLLGCDGPGGEIPKDATLFAKDGTAVISCDGGMNGARNRDGSPSGLKSGVKRPGQRQVFAQEALHLAIAGGRELVRARYGRAPDKTYFYGRETGGAQGLILAERHPEDVDSMILVNPAANFWDALVYEFNVARNISEISGHRVLKAVQCEAMLYAARQVLNGKEKRVGESDFFGYAAQIDPVFQRSYKTEKVRSMWHELLTAQTVSTNLRTRVYAVPLNVDLSPYINYMPWRVAWFFGENEMGHNVSPTELLAARESAAQLSASNDLTAFGKRGGELTVYIEANNPFVPAPLVDGWLPQVKGVKPRIERVKNLDNPLEAFALVVENKPAPAPAEKTSAPAPAAAAKKPAPAPAAAEKKPAPAPAAAAKKPAPAPAPAAAAKKPAPAPAK